MFVVRSAISFKKLISEMRVQPLPKNSGTICFTNTFPAGGNIVRWPEFHPFAKGTMVQKGGKTGMECLEMLEQR